MRDPSIHITQKQLASILEKVLVNEKDYNIDTNSLAKRILRLSKSHSIVHRSININNDRTEKKVNQLVKSPRYDADLFNKLLFMIRKRKKHYGIKQISAGSKDWGLIKEITEYAMEFCEQFNLSKKEGFTKFIELGLDKMNKYSLYKFSSMAESISYSYKAYLEIEKDDNPNETERLYKYYQDEVLKRTGIPVDYKDRPDKYACFIEIRSICENYGVNGKIFIDAQFDGLSFANGIPDPLQMIGDKAKDRLGRYLYKENIKPKAPAERSSSLRDILLMKE